MMVIANSAVAESKLARIEVTDHDKQVYHKTPHNVEVCYDKTVLVIKLVMHLWVFYHWWYHW